MIIDQNSLNNYKSNTSIDRINRTIVLLRFGLAPFFSCGLFYNFPDKENVGLCINALDNFVLLS